MFDTNTDFGQGETEFDQEATEVKRNYPAVSFKEFF